MQRAETQNTSERAAEAVHEAVDKAAQKASAVEDRLRETATETRDRAQRQTAELSDALVQYVHDKPIAALGIAFFAGLVASSIFRR